MLILKVEYLTGVCMATKHNDPGRSMPEWPPHPDRLYSALVAAAAEPEHGDDAYIPETSQGALKWIAELIVKQGPPQLSNSDAHWRSTPDVHMPSNPHEDEVWQKQKKNKPREPLGGLNLKSLLPIHRKKTSLPIPSVVPEDPAVYFIWPEAESNGHIDFLREICERVTYLGRSRSLVRVSVVNESPPATHVPDSLGQIQLRVPGENRLEYLIDNYKHKGGKPEPCPSVRYQKVDEQPQRGSKMLKSVFDRMYIFKPETSDPSLPITSTLKLTKALRQSIISCIEEEQRRYGIEPQIPDIVHGHGEHPHCAYVALPFVHPKQRHADGTIKGIAVIVPQNPNNDSLQALALGLNRLHENGLGIPGIGTWHLEEVPADDPPLKTLNINTWTKRSCVWTTVTPMVFGHFPKQKDGGEVKVILDSLKMIGIDPNLVEEIAVGRHSPLHGSSPSWCFKKKLNDIPSEEPQRMIRHVTLRFTHPVRGPIILGCMRYFGLGLMRPLEE